MTGVCYPIQTGRVRIDQMYIFGCLSAAYPDMAIAQGCGGDHDHAAQEMLYCDFTAAVSQNSANWILPATYVLIKVICILIVNWIKLKPSPIGGIVSSELGIVKVYLRVIPVTCKQIWIT